MNSLRASRASALLVLGMVGAALTSCASAPPAAAPERTTSPTPSVAAYDPDESAWFAAPFDPAEMSADPEPDGGDPWSDEPFPADAVEVAGTAETGTGEENPGSYVVTGDEQDPVPAADPCALLPLTEWQQWSADPAGQAYAVDPGEQCLYVQGKDLVRAAVSISLDGSSLVDQEDMDTATPLTDYGSDVYLLTAYPTPFAATVYSWRDDGALIVVTVYSRDPARSATQIQDAAAAWVTEIAGGL
jgi:hypothetical protein